MEWEGICGSMKKVKLSNPIRNSERNALHVHGIVWYVVELLSHPSNRFGEILVRSLDGADLRWWREKDSENV